MHADGAWAGQARAQFTASIRIDPELVRRDLERLAAKREGTSVLMASRLDAAREGRKPRVLPLAGGGTCVRKYVSANRFRWICR